MFFLAFIIRFKWCYLQTENSGSHFRPCYFHRCKIFSSISINAMKISLLLAPVIKFYMVNAIFFSNLPAILYLLAVCLCVQHDCVYCARFHVSPSKSRELPTALRPWKGNIKRRTYRQCSPRNILDHPPPKRIRERVTNKKTLFCP
jgi:hypothetical protein